MGILLSTSWNAYRCVDAAELIFEIKELGFREVELSFNLTSSIIDGIEQLIKTNEIKVKSLHNFCPIPDNVQRSFALPDYYSLAAKNQDERKRAVSQTKKTIETASRLSAQAVVLHTGRVEIPDRTKELIYLYEKKRQDTQEFIRLKGEMEKQREGLVKPFFENTLKSLDELNCWAEKFDISLGVENRIYHREIPNFQEIGQIMDKFKGSRIFYWHDVGHAQVMENLGFTVHEDYLKAYHKDMLGVHLHNLFGCHDHQAPIKGEFDFQLLKPYLKKETLKVIEAHHPASRQEIIESKVLLEKLFDGKI